MAQSDANRHSKGAGRLPSVEPANSSRRPADPTGEQLAVANAFFASLNPDDVAKPAMVEGIVSVSTKSSAGRGASSTSVNVPVASAANSSTNVDVLPEVASPEKQVWDDALKETLGSDLQQALPKPTVAKARRVKKAKAIPVARRTKDPAIEILERDIEPFHWKDLLTRKGLKRHSSFLISLLLHTLLLVFLSLLVVRSGIGDTTLFLDATAAPAAPDEAMLEVMDFDPVVFENEKFIEQDALNDIAEDQLEEEEAMRDALKTVEDLQLENPASGHAHNSKRAQGDGKSATFFGTKASGRRFVFVVDRSTSMEYGSQNFRSRELFNRYDIATSELLNAIESLQPHQEFFVFMFAHNTMPMFGKTSVEKSGETDFKMIQATEKNKIRFQRWLEDIRMGPGTDPRRALGLAIEMSPDAIFMLSDGEFVSEWNDNRPKTLDIVRKHSSQRSIVPINTISLVVEATIPVMGEIAERSRGMFKFTTIKDYIKEVAQLRGPMRARALEQLMTQADGWEERKDAIQKNLLPMLLDSSAIERLSAEALLHRATMGFFQGEVDSITDSHNDAVEQWNQIIREIDGYHRTQQISALGKGRELKEQVLHASLELDGDVLFDLFDRLDTELFTSLMMVEMVRTIELSHLEFGTSPESIGWLRYLMTRLNGKQPKERSQLGKIGWSTEQAQAAIDKLFESRKKRAFDMYRKYKDNDKGWHIRSRLGKAIVKKYPESKEASRVRLELAREQFKDETEPMPQSEEDRKVALDPFAE